MQIVSSTVGGGHQSVALALSEAFARARPEGSQVWIDDLYVDMTRFPASRFPWLYGAVTRHYRWLWRSIFDITNRRPGFARMERIGDALGGPFLGRTLAERRPDAVVSVLPGVNGLIRRSLDRHLLGARLEVVITDWADIHLSWITAGVDHYSVPTDNAGRTCFQNGASPDAVSVVGIPVRRQFVDIDSSETGRRTTRTRLGLPEERFVVLAMLGGEGSAGAVAHIAALAKVPLDADLLVACGRSQRLRRRIAALDGRQPIRTLGFVRDIADLMLSADLLVTKPGGVTLAEAFCCGLPIIAFDPLPGQEEGNIRYVTSTGAAELARSPRHLAELAAELRWSPTRRLRLAARAADLARPAAAENTVSGVLQRIGA